MNDIELNGETDDEDIEDGDTGFDDGSVPVRNIRGPRQPTEKRNTESTGTYIDHTTDHGARFWNLERDFVLPTKPVTGGKWALDYILEYSFEWLSSLWEAVVVTEQGSGDQNTSCEGQERIPESEKWDTERPRGPQTAVTTRSTFQSEWRRAEVVPRLRAKF